MFYKKNILKIMDTLKPIVFCDFDGTITSKETFVEMLKIFSPELSAQIIPQLYEKKMTIREGVRKMVEAIPSSSYQGILDYAKEQPIRSGLNELLDYLETKEIPFVVISGGLKCIVETTLNKHGLLKKVKDIWAVETSISGENLKVSSPAEGDTELVAKAEIMTRYPKTKKIAIGDSITDINMALTVSE